MDAVSMCGAGNCGVTTSGELGGSGGSAVRSTCRGGSTGASSTAGRGRRAPGTPGACGLRGGGLGDEAITPMLTLPPFDGGHAVLETTNILLDCGDALVRLAHLAERRVHRVGGVGHGQFQLRHLLDQLTDDSCEGVDAAPELVLFSLDCFAGLGHYAADFGEPINRLDKKRRRLGLARVEHRWC